MMSENSLGFVADDLRRRDYIGIAVKLPRFFDIIDVVQALKQRFVPSGAHTKSFKIEQAWSLGETVTMALKDEKTAFLFTDGEDHLAVIMGLRL